MSKDLVPLSGMIYAIREYVDSINNIHEDTQRQIFLNRSGDNCVGRENFRIESTFAIFLRFSLHPLCLCGEIISLWPKVTLRIFVNSHFLFIKTHLDHQ